MAETDAQETALDNVPQPAALQAWVVGTIGDLNTQIDQLAGYVGNDETALATLDQTRRQITAAGQDLQQAVGLILGLKDTVILLRTQRNDAVIEANAVTIERNNLTIELNTVTAQRDSAREEAEDAYANGYRAASGFDDLDEDDEDEELYAPPPVKDMSADVGRIIAGLREAGEEDAAFELEEFAASEFPDDRAETERLVVQYDRWLTALSTGNATSPVQAAKKSEA